MKCELNYIIHWAKKDFNDRKKKINLLIILGLGNLILFVLYYSQKLY